MAIIAAFLPVMANYSTIVLFLSSYVVLLIGYGALSISVTTNPVEIWAGPNSRSRLEKEYVDENFGPFYRTEQVFIKAVDVPSVSKAIPLNVMKYTTYYVSV